MKRHPWAAWQTRSAHGEAGPEKSAVPVQADHGSAGLVQECEHTNAVILVIPAERMATWDARMTREFIETTNARGRQGIIRERAAARQRPESQWRAPDRALGIMIHTDDKTRFFERDPAVVYDKADAMMRQQLREYHCTCDYFDNGAHPSPWELARNPRGRRSGACAWGSCQFRISITMEEHA